MTAPEGQDAGNEAAGGKSAQQVRADLAAARRSSNRRLLRFALLALVRFVAMAACAVALLVLEIKLLQQVLPSETSFDQVFNRLGLEMLAALAAGIVLGAGLTHRLGRRTFNADTRMAQAFVAALPLLALLGLGAFSR